MATLGRRLVCGGTAALATAVSAFAWGQGSAAAAATISITSPQGGRLYQSQPAIRGSATPDMAEHLSRDVALEVKETDQPGLVDESTAVAGTAGATTTASFGWQPALAYNGHYTALVTVWQANPAGIEDGPYSASQSFTMQAPPAKPGPPSVALGADRASTAVTWRPNGEPDLLGYQLLRDPAYTGGKVPTIAKGDALCSQSACSYPDSDVAPGKSYRYQVEAVRSAGPGTTSGVTATSDPSPQVAVPAAASSAAASQGDGAPMAAFARAGTQGAAPATATAAPESPALAKTGKVDLSGFSALLDRSRAGGSSSLAQEPDPGFQGALPYAPAQPEVGQGGTAVGVSTALGAPDRPSQVRPWAFFALGLLVTAVAMHLLWLRGEARHGAALDVLPLPSPAARAAGGEPGLAGPDRNPGPDAAPQPGPGRGAGPKGIRRLAG